MEKFMDKSENCSAAQGWSAQQLRQTLVSKQRLLEKHFQLTRSLSKTCLIYSSLVPMEEKFWWRGQSMGGVYFVLFWAPYTHRSRWLFIHLCLLAQCHLKGSNETQKSVIPGALDPFKNCYIWPQEVCFQRNRSERRRSQEKGCTHCQSMLPKFTVSFLPLRSEEDEVLQLVLKTQMFPVKSWTSSSKTTLKSFFPYAAHFPSLFLNLVLQSWLKNTFLTWMDEREALFFAAWMSGQMCQQHHVCCSHLCHYCMRETGAKRQQPGILFWLRKLYFPWSILQFCGRVWFELIASERRFLSPCGGIEYCINGTHWEKHFPLPTLSIQREKGIKGKSGSSWISPVLIIGWDMGITGDENINFRAC